MDSPSFPSSSRTPSPPTTQSNSQMPTGDSSKQEIEHEERHDDHRFITYDFPFDALNGPMVNPATSKSEYILLTPDSLFPRKPTVISRRDGKAVCEIQWSMFGNHSVRRGGVELKDMLKKKRVKLLGPCKWCFKCDRGNDFHWVDLCCYNEKEEVVARYHRQVEHPFLQDEKASLSVRQDYLDALDTILITALIMERRRMDSDQAFGRHPHANIGPRSRADSATDGPRPAIGSHKPIRPGAVRIGTA